MAENEYIEREAAIQVLCDACGNAACPKGLIPRCSYYEKMQSIPAADVRPVVLCQDCKHFQVNVSPSGYLPQGVPEWECRHWCRPTDPTDFCSYGEKREES